MADSVTTHQGEGTPHASQQSPSADATTPGQGNRHDANMNLIRRRLADAERTAKPVRRWWPRKP
jgi:hypothetical protein